jgi:hypothetical protein
MKHSLLILILLATLGCSRQAPVNESWRKLQGTWGFLDKYGNYNEAFFDDSTYITYNKQYGVLPVVKYRITGDSMYADVDRRDQKGVLIPVVEFEWISGDKVVFHSTTGLDTLERIIGDAVTLETTSPGTDSLKYRTAFNERYEKFLIAKGIITGEEARQQRENSQQADTLR